MGVYSGSYESIGSVWQSMILDTRFIDTDFNTNVIANDEQDAVIPSVWFNGVLPNLKGCSFTQTNPKTVRLHLSSTQYVRVIVRWRENTPSYNEFFEEILTKPRIVRVRLFPEIIRDTSLRWLTR